MGRSFLLCTLVALGTWLLPKAAQAQYRNQSLGVDAGYIRLLNKPSILTSGNTQVLRLTHGFRIGGEYGMKLGSDRAWFIVRGNFNFMTNADDPSASTHDQVFDTMFQESVGTLLGLEFNLGLRIYAATDRVRPYLQLGGAFMYLKSFQSAVQNSCSASLCGFERDLFSTSGVFSLHAQPGIEFVVGRDAALVIYGDLQQWILLNSEDNFSVTGAAGALFYF